jgi:hypothetical protein
VRELAGGLHHHSLSSEPPDAGSQRGCRHKEVFGLPAMAEDGVSARSMQYFGLFPISEGAFARSLAGHRRRGQETPPTRSPPPLGRPSPHRPPDPCLCSIRIQSISCGQNSALINPT